MASTYTINFGGVRMDVDYARVRKSREAAELSFLKL